MHNGSKTAKVNKVMSPPDVKIPDMKILPILFPIKLKTMTQAVTFSVISSGVSVSNSIDIGT